MATDAAQPEAWVARAWPAVLLAGAALLVLVAALGFLSYSLASLHRATEQRAEAREARRLLEHTLSLYKDVQSSVRGFALTGDEAYLEPYHAARAELPALQRDLATALGERLPDGLNRDGLFALLGQRMARAEQTVAMQRERRLEMPAGRILFDEGKQLMDRIRAIFARIDADLGRRIAERNARVLELRSLADHAAQAAAGLALALTIGAGALFLRERRARLGLEADLRAANRELGARVEARTAELAAARDRISAFAIEQERAVETERRRLSREVHDQIGQVFTAIKLIGGSVPATAFPPGQQEALQQALELGIAASRRITAELRPPLLDDLGLAAAVRHLLAGTCPAAGLEWHLEMEDAGRLAPERALGLFRIVQEALTNVQRHAQAREVRVVGLVQDAAYVLEIRDDGRGLDEGPRRPGALGLEGMRERARLLGGACTIAAVDASSAGSGTRVTVSLPLEG
jgi:protein-histidine pros-kinase